ncbi:MAG: hypothetical protein IJ252_14535 [Solobacterium sp.]|nr:hypothetical protein [Solobacterium sp.]
MASEYLKWKYRDVQHRDKPEYTPEEKRKNWWYYNKWLVIGGIIGAILLIDLFRTMAGLKTEHPDVQIALLSEYTISEEALGTLETSLAEYADDYNNDGKVLVRVVPYFLPDSPEAEEAVYKAYASEITLVSDMEECSSFLFLTDDPDSFQEAFEVLCYPDGTLPEEGTAGSDCAIAVNSLEAFTANEIDPSLRDYLKNYFIARRGFWREKTSENPEGCMEFFSKITQQKGN